MDNNNNTNNNNISFDIDLTNNNTERSKDFEDNANERNTLSKNENAVSTETNMHDDSFTQNNTQTIGIEDFNMFKKDLLNEVNKLFNEVFEKVNKANEINSQNVVNLEKLLKKMEDKVQPIAESNIILEEKTKDIIDKSSDAHNKILNEMQNLLSIVTKEIKKNEDIIKNNKDLFSEKTIENESIERIEKSSQDTKETESQSNKIPPQNLSFLGKIFQKIGL